MATFKPWRGLEKNLPDDITNGTIYFVTDTRDILIDMDFGRYILSDRWEDIPEPEAVVELVTIETPEEKQESVTITRKPVTPTPTEPDPGEDGGDSGGTGGGDSGSGGTGGDSGGTGGETGGGDSGETGGGTGGGGDSGETGGGTTEPEPEPEEPQEEVILGYPEPENYVDEYGTFHMFGGI